MDHVRKPPPGATMTAAPLALAASGKKGVSVAIITLRANLLPYWLCQDSGFFAPGSGPVPTSIALGCAGVAMGVIRSFCAWADAASETTNASAANTKREVVDRAKARFVQRFDICLTPLFPPTVFLFVVEGYYRRRSSSATTDRSPSLQWGTIWKVKIASGE